MWAIIGILFVAGVITYIDVPSMLQKRMIKESVVFLLLLGIAVILSVLEAIRISLPNPLDWLISIHKPMSDMLFEILE